MTQKMREIVERMLSDKAKRRWRRGARSVVGCVVALATLYSLILPALTFAKDTVCGMEEHTHDASCYTTETVSGEMELACDKASIGVHVHTEDCYDTNHKTVCGYADYVVHTHTDACYADGVLVCPLDELKAHTHTDGCYTEVTTLTCGQEEAEGVHTHTEGCYTTTREQTCLKPEIILHTHTDDCFETLEDETKILACTQTEVREHIHGEDCFREKQVQVLTCGMEEHTHTDDCYDTETTPPTEETTAPTQETTAPTEETTAPTEETTAPTEETTIPTEETTAPTEGTTAPTEDTTVPPDESDVPAKGLTTPAEKVTLGITKTNAISLMTAGSVVVAQGTSGNINWMITSVSGEYILTLSGVGAMNDYHTEYDSDFNLITDIPWYSYRSSIKTVVIKEDVTSIGNYAFYGCSSLTSVTIPEGVTSIGENAFAGCSRLTSLTIPDSVTSIGNSAFQNCGSLTSVLIPKGVTSVGDSAFYYCSSLASVTIPEGVTSIGNSAFYYCRSLTSVTIPEGVTSVGDRAFYNCRGLTSVTIPDSVSGIGNYAFYNCSSLTSVTIPDRVTSIGIYVFSGCSSLSSLEIGNGVTNIDNNAFYNCSNLTTITLNAKTLASVSSYAFSGDKNIQQIIIGEGVDTLYPGLFSVIKSTTGSVPQVTFNGYFTLDSTFKDTSLLGAAGSRIGAGSTYYADENGAIYSVVSGGAYCIYSPDSGYVPPATIPTESGDGSTYTVYSTTAPVAAGNTGNLIWLLYQNGDSYDLIIAGSGAMPSYSSNYNVPWYSYRNNINTVVIGDGVTSIGSYAFYYCGSLTSVTIPDGVTSIGSYAFQSCRSLTSVTIPNSVTSIGNYAFDGCSKLASVTIPNSVTSIGSYAFRNCSSLTTVTIPDRVTSIGNNAFDGCSKLASVTIPNGITSIGSFVFRDCSSLTSVTIPEGVTNIGSRAFYNCSSLTSVTIPDSVTSIGSSAFQNCSSLTSVTIPDSVTSIGSSAFQNCSSLTSVDLPTGWVAFGDGVFFECTNLAPLDTLLSGTYYIDSNEVIYGVAETTAYVYYCPSGVEPAAEIPNENGTGTYAVTDMVATGVDGDITWTVTGGNGYYTLTISGTGAIPNYGYSSMPWYKYRDNINTVVVEAGVTGIGSYAFYECSRLTMVTILDGVASLGDYAFSGCSSLTSVTIPEGVTSIGGSAFEGCSSLISVDLPEGWISFGSDAFAGCPAYETLTGSESNYYVDANGVIYAIVSSENACVVFCMEGVTPATQIPNEDNTGVYQVLADVTFVAGGETGPLMWSVTGSDGNYTLTISGNGDMPSYLHEYSYGDYVFRRIERPWDSCGDIQTVIIEAGVTGIGNYAFDNCTSLTSVTIPDGVTSIGNYAFDNCTSLTSVTIPDGVTSIGDSAFSGCTGLNSATIPDSVTSIGDSAFSGCTSLTSMTIPDGVTSIGDSAFRDCSNLTTVDLPKGWVALGSGAFYGCTGLGMLSNLETGADYIDENEALYLIGPDSRAYVVYCPDGVTVYDEIYSEDGTVVYPVVADATYIDGGSESGIWWAVTRKDSRMILTVGGEGVVSGGYYPPWRQYMSSITDVDIQEGITGVGNSAFSDYTGLTSVTVRNGVASIGDYAFYNCSSLTSVTISEGVTSIGDSAFRNCSSLTSVTIPEGVTSIGDSAFRNCSGLTSVTLLEGAANIGDYAFNNCGNLTTVNVEKGVSSIGVSAFSSCSSLISITIPDGVTSIGDSAFEDCGSLTAVTIGTGITTIGKSTFKDCISLTAITIPEGVTSIGNSAFYDCSGLTTVTIPEGVTSIGNYAFYDCSSLTAVTIPEGVTSIGDRAFENCSSLTSVEIGEGITAIGDHMFSSCSSLKSVTIPRSVDCIGYCAFWNCSSLTSVTIPDSVTSISGNAFENCSSLTSVTIPDSVTSISDNVFENCSGLKSVDLPQGWVSFGYSVFENCAGVAPLMKLEKNTYYIDCNEVLYRVVGGYNPVACVAYNLYGKSVLDEIPNQKGTGSYTVPVSGVYVTEGNYSTFWWFIAGEEGDYSFVVGGSGDLPECYEEGWMKWTQYRDDITNAVVADGIKTLPGYTFDFGNLTSVEVADSVTSLGGAFGWHKKLVSVKLGSGLTKLDDFEFAGCSSLTTITIPAGITSIGSHAFSECSSLTSLTIPESVTRIGILAFDRCSSLTSMVIPKNVTSIGEEAFGGCIRLTSVEIGEGVTSIGDCAFWGCSSLTSITLNAKALSSVAYKAFLEDKGIRQIIIGRGVDVLYPSLFNAVSAVSRSEVQVSFAGPNYFTLDSSFTDTSILEDIGSRLKAGFTYFADENGALYLIVGGEAYYIYSPMFQYVPPKYIPTERDDGSVYKVYSTKLPAEVHYVNDLVWIIYKDGNTYDLVVVGSGAIPDYITTNAPWYSYRKDIASVYLGEGVTGIGAYAFQDCAKVTEVEIPASVTAIDARAFKGCTSLCGITVADGNPSYQGIRGILYDVELTTLIYCPEGKDTATEIPETVTAIGDYAFGFNGVLTKVDFPSGVVTIGEGAFYECDSLLELALPEELTSIGDYAFYGCDSLTTVTIPASVTDIGTCAFRNSGNLAQINTSGSYFVLGADVFTGTACYYDTLKSMGSGLHYIDEEGGLYWINEGIAYYIGCPKSAADYMQLAKTPRIGDLGPYWVDIEAKFLAYGTAGDLYWYIVEEYDKKILVIGGEGPMPDYSSSNMPWYSYRSSLNEIIIEDGVSGIGSNAFYGFNSIRRVNLPHSWITVGHNAFYGCGDFGRLNSLECYSDSNYVTYRLCEDGNAYILFNPAGVAVFPTALPDQEGNPDVYPVMEGKKYVASGYTGELWWIIANSSGRYTLTIGGEGVMPDYSNGGAPWHSYNSSLNELIIQDGVTGIGDYAFTDCSNLTSADLPMGWVALGLDAFAGCTGLHNLNAIGKKGIYYIDANDVIYVRNGSSAYVAYCPTGVDALKEIPNEDGTGVYPVTQASGQAGDLSWTITEKNGVCTLTISGSGAIPDYSITGIPWYNFRDSIESVIIEDGVTRIGSYSFFNCVNLETVTIPKGVAGIGESAFGNCASLTTIAIPRGVTSVGKSAFCNCTKLTSITFPDSITNIGSYALSGCGSLDSVSLPVNWVTYGNDIFLGCSNFEELNCLNDLFCYVDENNVAYRLGADGKAYVVYCPDGVTEYPAAIPDEAGNPDVYPTVTDRKYVAGGAVDDLWWIITEKYGDRTLTIGGKGEMPNYQDGHSMPWYGYRDGIEAVVVEDGVISIGDYAFSGCTSLTSVTIPESVTSIGNHAFYNCGSLTMAAIPDGVTSIGSFVFAYCRSLTSVTIPEGVTSIGRCAFYNCRDLTSVTIPDSVTSIGGYAFFNCSSLTSVTLPNRVSSISTGAFYGCSSLSSVHMPQGWVSLGSKVFYGCENLGVLIALNDCECYSDNNHVIYLLGEDGNAYIVYSPPGVTDFPAALPDQEGNPDVYPVVTGVYVAGGKTGGLSWFIVERDGKCTLTIRGQGAMPDYAAMTAPWSNYKASLDEVIIREGVTSIGINALNDCGRLASVTFEKPESITILPDLAMANCPALIQVNGKSTIANAIATFTNPDLELGQLVFFNTGLSGEMQPTQDAIEITAEGGSRLQIVTTPDTRDGDYTRYTGETGKTLLALDGAIAATGFKVYFAFSSTPGKLGITEGEHKFEGNRTGKLYPVSVSVLQGANIYCITLPAVEPGDTLSFEVEYKYPSPDSPDSTLTIWGEAEAGDQAARSAQGSFACHVLSWVTEPETYTVTKRLSSTPKLYGDGTEDGYLSVQDLSYTIALTQDNQRTAPQGLGVDPVISVDYFDVLTLSEDLAWRQEILDAVAAGRWSWLNGEFTAAGRSICSISGTGVTSASLSLTDDGELCVSWHYTSPSTGLQNQGYTLAIMGDCILGKQASVTELDDSYTITNTVTAVEHFKYSADQTDTAATTNTIVPTEATMVPNKRSTGDTYYGEYYPYTITMSNYGSRHLRYINTVTDVLLTDLYITPADMIQMLRSDQGGENLTITIKNATLYQQLPKSTVTGTNGREYSPTIQNTSLNTEYVDKRLTPEDDSVFVSDGNAELTIGWKGDKLVLQADVGEDASMPTSIQVEDAASLQAELDKLGYYVTPGVQYKVCWNFENKLPLWSGETRTYVIRSTVKDGFMSIGMDRDLCAGGKSLGPNVVAVKYTINGKEITASASTPTYEIYNDFYVVTDVYEDGEPVDGRTIMKGGGVADFYVSFSHSGTASYDVVPLVDRMRGAEILMVRATENPHLGTEYGLTPQSVGGLDYYLLDTPGTYENVMVGGYLAESVTVRSYDADRVDPEIFKEDYGALDISSCDPDGLDTTIRWYFTGISGSAGRTLRFKVLMAPVGDYASSLIFGADNQVWLNDHQTHRLWDGEGIFASYIDFSKNIALEHMSGTNRRDVLDEDNYTLIYEGDTVTYRLHLRGALNEASVQAGRTLVVPGKVVYDSLPKSINGYRWSTANLTGIEYVISDEEDVEVVNRDHWQIVDQKPGTLTDTDVDQQYLDWDDDFCVTFHATGDVYMYITLQFPEGDDWERYADAYGAERLENVYHYGAAIKTVYHDLVVESTATLVKGVDSTGVVKDAYYYPSSEESSRYFYVNKDSQDRAVTYYVALYNEGRARLYLDNIQDSLPEGFTLCSVAGTGSGFAHISDAEGAGVKYVSANISATQQDGKLLFRASGGDLSYDSYYGKYYLLPHQALVFGYRCYTNNWEDTFEFCENTAAMAYFDYNTAGMKLGSSQITGSGNLTRKNDGTCRLLDNGTAGKYGFTTDFADASTQWLSSAVVVQRGEIIPGISKWVSKVTEPLDSNNSGRTNFASYNDSITWKIAARNDGTAPIRDYVLTDVMQTDYVFDSYVSYTIHFGDRFGNPSALDKPDEPEVLFKISDIPENGSKTIVTKTFGTLEVSRSETDQGPSLSIRFKDDKAAIPEGGYGVLEVTTKSGITHRNTTYTNTSYITPAQTWEESQVNVGDVVELDGKKSVQASALITVAASYMTTSVKRVEEKGNPDNFATSDSSRNAIVIPEGEKPFTYTLSVTNTSSRDDQTMDRLVLIDSLPGQGDHSVLLDTDLRFSQFRVDLAETPNFTVTIVDKDGNETPLRPGTDYRLEFSDKTSFTNEDWEYNLENEEPSEADRDWYTTPGPNTRSFRVVITEAEHNRLIAAKATVTVSFDARIHPEDLTSGEALPGETAWNSFGYQYGLTGSTIVLSAAPLKVGVKLPSVPVLVKRIQTPEGSAFPTEQDETFRYVIYKQSGANVLNLDGLTEAQIGEALTQANVEFTCVELTVASGETESEMRMLKDQNRWSYTDRQWTESTEEPWDWEDGASYIFYELPIENKSAEDYAFGSLGGVRRNSFRYVHDAYNKYTVISVNVRRVWNISLLKVADNEKQQVLPGAWFGLYSPNAEDRYKGQIPEGLTEAVPESLEYGENTYYLTDIRQSGADGTILWKDLEELRYVLRELQPPAGYHYSDELYLLERPEEVYFNTADITVKNRSGYEMPESGGVGTGVYTRMGMLLTVTAGAALIVCRRRKKREEA